ncbi:MAG: hypothetical protein M0Z70_07045 [Nitrospiraceae bacterium]|jgi:hypothetical protein|nr:hypothetical protein [Nitrospirota bacterium]MDA8339038.1 hypothetical protein [Nitrospiraceae bacterium]
MKKVVLVIVVLMLFTMGSVVYAGQFGPPEPAAKEGGVALGVGYFYYTAKWKPKDSDWEEGKVRQNQAYLQASYGFIKNGEIYLRVGGADAKLKEAFFDNSDFKRGLKPFGTLGVKGVFNITPSFGIGPFLQASLFPSYKDDTTGTATISGIPVSGTETLKVIKPREINIGLGLQGKIGEAILYGGPVIYWEKAKADWTFTGTIAGIPVSLSDSTTYKEKNNIGGFAGVRLPLGKGLNFEVEGQLKSRFSMGGALTYSF